MKGLGIFYCSADPLSRTGIPSGTKVGSDEDWQSDIIRLGPWEKCSPWVETKLINWSRSSFSPERIGVVLCQECSSALDLAWTLVGANAAEAWNSVLCARQTMGRGQLRRQWFSPAGNLYAAVVLPSVSPSWANFLPLFVGSGVLFGLQTLGVSCQIKWPNDLMLHRTKVGGVLVEERCGVAVAGIGLNLKRGPDGEMLRENAAFPASCLSYHGYAFTAIGLWTHLVDFLQVWYERTVAAGSPSALVSLIHDHIALLGCRVVVSDRGASSVSGRILGLAQDGGLRLAVGHEEIVIHSGSISVMQS